MALTFGYSEAVMIPPAVEVAGQKDPKAPAAAAVVPLRVAIDALIKAKDHAGGAPAGERYARFLRAIGACADGEFLDRPIVSVSRGQYPALTMTGFVPKSSQNILPPEASSLDVGRRLRRSD